MTKSVREMNPVEREMVLQRRSDAVAYDRTPRPEDVPGVVLVRRVADGWLEAKSAPDAADLIASGEYRPFQATEGYTEHGTLTGGADPSWVAFGEQERIAALARLLAEDQTERAVQDDLEAVIERIRAMTPEEQARLEAELSQPVAGAGAGLVRPPH